MSKLKVYFHTLYYTTGNVMLIFSSKTHAHQDVIKAKQASKAACVNAIYYRQ